jgi:hypothetical protein
MKKIDIYELDIKSMETLLSYMAKGENICEDYGVEAYGLDYHINQTYFVGKTLFIDLVPYDRTDVIAFSDSITFNFSSECYGLFSGGPRRLLSIAAMRALEQILVKNNIKHTSKWLS